MIQFLFTSLCEDTNISKTYFSMSSNISEKESSGNKCVKVPPVKVNLRTGGDAKATSCSSPQRLPKKSKVV